MGWIAANIGTIIVGLMLLAVVGLVIRKMHRDKKNGNCSGGCSGCSGCSGSCNYTGNSLN